MSDVEAWLEAWMEGVPEALRQRILEGVREHVQRATRNVQRDVRSDQPFSAVLAGAGEEMLAEVQSAPASRQQALTLLAADALMTFACEADAETGREPL